MASWRMEVQSTESQRSTILYISSRDTCGAEDNVFGRLIAPVNCSINSTYVGYTFTFTVTHTVVLRSMKGKRPYITPVNAELEDLT